MTKSAGQSPAELAALRRPMGNDTTWHALRHYQAINIVILMALFLGTCVGWSLLYPEQLRFASIGNLAVLSQPRCQSPQLWQLASDC